MNTDPGSLVFDLKALGFSLGIPDLDIQVQSGTLKPENSPSDFVLTPTPDDVIPSLSTHRYKDGILLSFPTGKSGLQDLTDRQRNELRDYVRLKTQNIRALTDSLDVVAAPH